MDDEHKDLANRTLLGACRKLTRQQWYNVKHTCINHFLSESGIRASKHDNVEKPPKMTLEDWMSVS